MKDTILAISYFVHLIATVIWIGGLAMILFLVWPETARSLTNQEERRRVVLGVQTRFRPMANLSLVMLVGTGLVQMSGDPNYEGFLTFKNTWSFAMLLKHVVFAAMVGLTFLTQFWLAPALERAILLASKGQPNELETLLAREVRLMWSLAGLGAIVLVFTAIATAQ
ncbi:MAG: CopD family protein [Chloroflexi bacterium]|nr:CopD family protein [Chloroflexota bacterium]